MSNINTFWWVENTLMPSPSSIGYDIEDLDNDSYRSPITGNLTRNRIAPRWFKLSIEYKAIEGSMVETIAEAINTNQTYNTSVRSPLFGTNDKVTFEAYTSKMHLNPIKIGDGSIRYDLSFSVIQAKKGSHQ